MARLRVLADGGYEYDPNGQYEYLGAGQVEVEAFTYTIADSEGLTSEATIEITITGVNAAPVAENDEGETNEDEALEILVEDLLGNDSDVDSETLVLNVVAGPLHGTLANLGDGSFLYTPNENYHGPDRFTYEVFDGDDTSNLATVFLTVESINDEPTIELEGEFEIDEGSGIIASGSFVDFDADDSWTVIVDYGDGTDPEELDFTAGKTFELEHIYENNGDYVIIVTVTDGEDASVEGEITVLVANVDPAGLAIDVPESGLVDEPLIINGLFFDPGIADGFEVLVDWGDGESETVEVTGSDGTWEFAAEHTYEADGIYVVSFEVSDGDGGTAETSVSVVIEEDDTPKPPGTTLDDGILFISGTEQADVVTILRFSSTQIIVYATYGQTDVTSIFSTDEIDRIVATLHAGSDQFVVSNFVSIPLLVDAGIGNDEITSGGSPAIIVGGEGDDTLNGGSKRDILIGGLGSDRVAGGGSSDLLIAGETSFDARKSALLAIMGEWESARSLSQRSGQYSRRNGTRAERAECVPPVR